MFLEDGRIKIDNNGIEKSIRPLAMTRKNRLLADGKEGAQEWAVIASLMETCALNGVNPCEYLVWAFDVLCNGHSQSRVDELPPWARAEHKPAGQAA